MLARPAYPVDTVTGCCFITQRHELAPGEQVCDLEIYVDALPPFGRLVVSPAGVRLMANCIGIEIPDRDVVAENHELKVSNRELQLENERLRRAFVQVVDAARLAQVAESAELAELLLEEAT